MVMLRETTGWKYKTASPGTKNCIFVFLFSERDEKDALRK